MSIEQKIAQILAESRSADDQVEEIVEENVVTKNAAAGDQAVIRTAINSVPNGGETPNEANAKNNAEDEKEAEVASKKPNVVTAKAEAGDQAVIRTAKDSIPATAPGAAVNFKEDMDALFNGEELTEEFKEKATTIFEAAVMTRINEAFATIEEEFEARLEEEAAKNQEGLVEKVDGYLNYIVEQWFTQNEIALESGMKSEILEGFVEGMKNLFQEHYIDVPDEQFDAVGDLHDTISQLETKLDESLESNVEMRTQISTMIREGLVEDFCKELTDTEVEKFKSLSEELSYSSEEAFTSKLEIIKENYFSKKTGKSASSVVSDKPIQLTEEIKHVDQNVARYLDTFNRIKI